MKKRLLASVILLGLGGTLSASELRQAERPIEGRYIVVFHDETSTDRNAQIVSDAMSAAADMAVRYSVEVEHVYEHALKGFSIATAKEGIDKLLSDPRVAFVEEDGVVSISATQSNATWGLDRVDQRDRPLNGTYVYDTTASNVRAYIIDTGIRTAHNDFGGRVLSGYTSISDGQGTNDCNGHGTHVAGTVGGATWGVAKAARLVPVRVLGCTGSGTNAGVIAGIDWVRANHVKPAVANMSLGGGASSATDTAVNNLINSGVTVVVAAGNDNANACNYSPARVANAITVGSTTSTDARSNFSNFGNCVNIFAPGSSITSAWHTSNTATNSISGTSMAAPHVAGVAALYLANNPSANNGTVATAIYNNASTGKVTSAGTGSPNRLLYSLWSGGGGGTPPPSAPCSGTGCSNHTGSLSGTGASAVQPGGTYYQSTVSGTHRGWLTGPSNADFDLELYRWSGSRWNRVARSTGSTSTEQISYSGTAGFYYWRVLSYSGSGSYSLWIQRP